MAKIGVYICHCGVNIASSVDVERVRKEAEHYPGVFVARTYAYMCSDPGQELIRKDIGEYGLDRIVVAACSPRMHEVTFRRTCESAGVNAYCFEMTNIREQCSWVHDNKAEATAKAIDLVRSSLSRAALLEPLTTQEVPVTPAALVVGGGIAGIQAALDIANAGFQVYLVEKEPSIGGHMAQLDKTFPTLDCSACILTPKMVDVTQHENIRLLTYAEVKNVSGYVGNFKVDIRKKTAFVDWSKCNGCGECADVCTVSVENTFECGLSDRKAIYRPFPQAVPNKFTVEWSGHPPCRVECPAGVNVQGYIALIKAGKYEEALKLERKANPLASVCGRVCNHPCESECLRAKVDEPVAIASLKRFIADCGSYPLEQKNPQGERVAVVGSGPAGLACAYFLALKDYRVTVYESEQVVGGLLAFGIPEFRLPREALRQDIDFIRSFGVEMKTGVRIGKDTTVEDLRKEFKAVFLATGAHEELKLGVEGENLKGVLHCVSFLKEVNFGRKVELGKKVAVIGGGNAAIDAARVAKRFGCDVTILYRRSWKEMPANFWEVDEAEKEGVKIEFLAAPVRIIGKNKVESIECIQMALGEPDESGRRRPIPVEGSEFTLDVENVIVAISQRPNLDDLSGDLKSTKWSTLVVDENTQMTSVKGVFAGGDLTLGPKTIIEAVATGKTAANGIDAYIRGVPVGIPKAHCHVTEKEGLERIKRASRVKMRTRAAEKRGFTDEVEMGFTEEEAREESERCLNCGICSQCHECVRICEPGAIDFSLEDEVVSVDVGTIVVATGFEPFDAGRKPELAYAVYPNVVTGIEFERLVAASGPTGGKIVIDGKTPKRVVFIQCVGSRDKNLGNAWCSRVCCMYATKQAHLVKEKIPDAQVTVLYMDLRAFGKGYEEFYDRVRAEGVLFRRANGSEIYKKGEGLVVRTEDTLLGKTVEVEADLVVLSAGLESGAGSQAIAKLLKLSRSPDGFLMEAHPKLRPVDTATDGVYLAGCCQSPKDIPDTVAQAKAAAASAIIPMVRGKVFVEPINARVDEDVCCGCRVCESMCEYKATVFDEEKGVMTVNAALCKGCGSCGGACPTGAMSIIHYTDGQIFAQLESLTEIAVE